MITAIIAALGPKLLGIMAVVLGAIGLAFQQRLAGAKAERAKQAAGKLAAAEDRQEMDREATAAERKAAGMTDEEAKAEALKWAKH